MEKQITVSYDVIVKASLSTKEEAAKVSLLVTVPYGPQPKEEGAERPASSTITDLPPESVDEITAALKKVLETPEAAKCVDDAILRASEAASQAARVPPITGEPGQPAEAATPTSSTKKK